MNNIEFSNEVIERLIDAGVKEFCLSTGARNASLVEAISGRSDVKVYSFFDERSAAFFALGRARSLGAAVAVTCTSGTAVAELLPATMEAHYSSVPLVLLTADRPRVFRGTGSPQTVDQIALFKGHVALQVDVEAGGGISEFKIPSAPVHFNVCFDEPILGQPGARDSRVQLQQTTASWQSRSKQPLLIASGLSPAEARALLPALKKLTVPMVLEATSNLSGHEALKDLQIPTWSVRAENFYEHFDSLIRVGSVPTLRLFRDLDLSLSKVPVLSFTDKPFSGLARQSNQCLNSLADLNDFIEAVHFDTNASLQVLKADVERLQGAISEFPESELMCFVQLKKALPANSRLFLGNSLPIREWDAVCDFENDRSQEVYAQRGVNGIDGLVSQFLGMCVDGRENVLILGDLSFLYDSSGLWALEQLQPLLNIKIVVVNNSGGRIFRGLFENAMLQTEHKFEMRGLSDFWGLDYVKVTGKGIQHFDYLELPQRCLVEFQPELNASDQAWKSLRALYV